MKRTLLLAKPDECFRDKEVTITKRDRVKLLKRTRELLAMPGGWTQGTWVRKLTRQREGNDLGLAFCINGAANHAFNELFAKRFGGEVSVSGVDVLDMLSVNALARARGFDDAMTANDAESRTRKNHGLSSRGQEAMLQLIDEKLAEEGVAAAT